MNYKRAIKTAAIIWVIGVIFFLIGSFLPLIIDPELQANLTLAIAFVPLAWFGTRYYYKGGDQTRGYQLAFVFVSMAALLDAIITVPIFMMPIGVGHAAFFGTLGFWLLVAEYAGIVIVYDFTRKRKSIKV